MANSKFPWVYLVVAIRRIFRWSPARKEVKLRCVVGARKDLYECEKCEKETKKIEIDHIDPVGSSPKDFEGWDNYLRRMFVSADKLMGLCHDCHQTKTQKERKARLEAKKQKKG